jgi:hypothetical protein
LKATGLRPGERVTVKAGSKDARKISWESKAVFEADAAGVVDVGRQAPVSGGYGEADIFGLLWSMKRGNSNSKKPVGYRDDEVNGWTVDFSVADSAGATASTRFRCVFQMPGRGLVRLPLEQDGLFGFLYYPAEGGPFPLERSLENRTAGRRTQSRTHKRPRIRPFALESRSEMISPAVRLSFP